MIKSSASPRIRDNDYGTLQPPTVGRWEPTLPVSVVIPAYKAQHKLDLTLAALAAQTYPGHLIEVVIADDGSDPPLRLPEIRPERTRIVPSLPGGWGCAHAYRSGVLAADGDVIVRVDADMVCFHDNVEAQARWHHLADHLVVVGHKRFVDYRAESLSPQEVYDAVAGGDGEKLFTSDEYKGHHYEAFIEETDQLRAAGAHASRAFTGASASYHRAFYHDAGGVDSEMIMGEDTDLGYRLGQAGAVFVPELTSSSWHLGWSTTMTDGERASRYCQPFYANRVLIPRTRRPDPGRQWRVPGVEAVVDVTAATWEQARATVSGLTSGLVSDVAIKLVGPWSAIDDGRRDLLADPLLELRLMREGFGDDGRVELVESVQRTAFPAPYRFHCPAGWVPTSAALRRLIHLAEHERYGLVVLDLPADRSTPGSVATPETAPGAPETATEAPAEAAVETAAEPAANAAMARAAEPARTARFEQTRAFARAYRVAAPADDIDDVVREMFGSHAVDGTESALTRASPGGPPKMAEDWEATARRMEASAARWRAQARQLGEELRALKAAQNRRLGRRIRRRLGRIRRALLGRSPAATATAPNAPDAATTPSATSATNAAGAAGAANGAGAGSAAAGDTAQGSAA